MKRFILLSLLLVGILSTDSPCRKLNFFGNSVQNKAILSNVIILGKLGMRIPLENDLYKATIFIETILKGSLGNWDKNLIIAGEFSSKNSTSDLCHFKSIAEESQIYFFEVSSMKNGEYRVLFDPEASSSENFEIINKTICPNCVEAPKLHIKEQNVAENTVQLDCISESMPTPKIAWTKAGEKGDLTVTTLRNGARLTFTSTNDSKSEMFICSGANVLGEVTTNVISRVINQKPADSVSRCPTNDKTLCNGYGKCYKDKIDYGKMFCRCNAGFYGENCSSKNPKEPIDTKPMLRSNSNYMEKRDKLEIQKMMDAAASKIALMYIIIGAAIVLGGCIIIIIIIIIMWKCYYNRNLRNSRDIVEEDEKSYGTNNRANGADTMPITKFNDTAPLYSPNKNLVSIPVPLLSFSDSQRKNDYNLNFSGDGIYEGVTIPLSMDSPSHRSHAL